MPGRSKTTICAEGWWYLSILSFVMLAAILREINLLVVLAGMMLGPFLISWRLAAISMRRLDVSRRLPQRVVAGELSQVEIAAANRRRRLGSWVVVVEDGIEPTHGGSNRSSVQLLIPHVAAGDTGRASYRCLFHRRGRYRFGPLVVSTRFPLGLVQSSIRDKMREELIVLPRLGRLAHQWTRIIEAERVGGRPSPRRHGVMEGDYYGVREWRAGDSKRWIHWRTSARLSQLAVLQFEQQVNRDAALILDLWRPVEPTERDLEHVETAVSFAASAVADLCRRGGSRLFVAVCGEETFCWSALTASPLVRREILERLAVVEPTNEGALEEVAERALERTGPGAQVFVISTRSAESRRREAGRAADGDRRRRAALENARWIDVTSEELATVFQLV